MQPITDGPAVRSLASDPDASPDASPVVSLAFLALVALPLLVASYPVIVTGLLVGVVAVAALSRSLAGRIGRHRGRVRQFRLPGLGTVEYRFTRV
ncbi:MAG: hypothetical protein ACOCRD_04755 [Halorubrum sp.]